MSTAYHTDFAYLARMSRARRVWRRLCRRVDCYVPLHGGRLTFAGKFWLTYLLIASLCVVVGTSIGYAEAARRVLP